CIRSGANLRLQWRAGSAQRIRRASGATGSGPSTTARRGGLDRRWLVGAQVPGPSRWWLLFPLAQALPEQLLYRPYDTPFARIAGASLNHRLSPDTSRDERQSADLSGRNRSVLRRPEFPQLNHTAVAGRTGRRSGGDPGHRRHARSAEIRDVPSTHSG